MEAVAASCFVQIQRGNKLEQQVSICNKLGLHARAAAKFVGLASQFESKIEVDKDGRTVNGKSIMGVMMLAASKGSLITLKIEGEDASEAMEQLLDLINNRFDEEE